MLARSFGNYRKKMRDRSMRADAEGQNGRIRVQVLDATEALAALARPPLPPPPQPPRLSCCCRRSSSSGATYIVARLHTAVKLFSSLSHCTLFYRVSCQNKSGRSLHQLESLERVFARTGSASSGNHMLRGHKTVHLIRPLTKLLVLPVRLHGVLCVFSSE